MWVTTLDCTLGGLILQQEALRSTSSSPLSSPFQMSDKPLRRESSVESHHSVPEPPPCTQPRPATRADSPYSVIEISSGSEHGISPPAIPRLVRPRGRSTRAGGRDDEVISISSDSEPERPAGQACSPDAPPPSSAPPSSSAPAPPSDAALELSEQCDGEAADEPQEHHGGENVGSASALDRTRWIRSDDVEAMCAVIDGKFREDPSRTALLNGPFYGVSDNARDSHEANVNYPRDSASFDDARRSSDIENRSPTVEPLRIGDVEAMLVSLESLDPYTFETFIEPALVRSSLLRQADSTWFLNVIIWHRVRILLFYLGYVYSYMTCTGRYRACH